jgi:hypothetical protein
LLQVIEQHKHLSSAEAAAVAVCRQMAVAAEELEESF